MPLADDVLRTYLFLLGTSALLTVALALLGRLGLPIGSWLLRLAGAGTRASLQDALDFALAGGVLITLLGAGIVALRRAPDDRSWPVRLALVSFLVAALSLVVPFILGVWAGPSSGPLISFWVALFVAGFSVRSSAGRRRPPARRSRRRGRGKRPGRPSPRPIRTEAARWVPPRR